jgi:hypothetical protein
MNYNVIAYSLYIPLTIALTIWIAKSLHKNTRAFLLEKFHNNDELTSATNNLIQTGFYLIALGFSFMYMRIKDVAHYTYGYEISSQLRSSQETMESLAIKMGTFTFFLGMLLFLNFFIMIKIQSPKNEAEHL